MRLCIVRHGKAEPAVSAQPDAGRALVERGRDQAAWLAGELAERPLPVSIVSSPIRRAAETAEILGRVLRLAAEFDPRLRTGLGVAEALSLIAERAAEPSLLIVGHNPQLEELLAHLVDGRRAGPLRTGEAAIIDLDAAAPREGRARLVERLRLED